MGNRTTFPLFIQTLNFFQDDVLSRSLDVDAPPSKILSPLPDWFQELPYLPAVLADSRRSSRMPEISLQVAPPPKPLVDPAVQEPIESAFERAMAESEKQEWLAMKERLMDFLVRYFDVPSFEKIVQREVPEFSVSIPWPPMRTLVNRSFNKIFSPNRYDLPFWAFFRDVGARRGIPAQEMSDLEAAFKDMHEKRKIRGAMNFSAEVGRRLRGEPPRRTSLLRPSAADDEVAVDDEDTADVDAIPAASPHERLAIANTMSQAQMKNILASFGLVPVAGKLELILSSREDFTDRFADEGGDLAASAAQVLRQWHVVIAASTGAVEILFDYLASHPAQIPNALKELGLAGNVSSLWTAVAAFERLNR